MDRYGPSDGMAEMSMPMVKAPREPSIADVVDELERTVMGFAEVLGMLDNTLAPILKPDDTPAAAESHDRQRDGYISGMNIRLRRVDEELLALMRRTSETTTRIDL